MDEIPPDPHFYFLKFGPINVHGGTSFGGQVVPSGVAPDLLLDQIGGKGVTLYSNRNSRTSTRLHGCIALNPEGELQQKEIFHPLLVFDSFELWLHLYFFLIWGR
ncbi:hypothetical protein VN97_g4073 [Penicillium thymicola]|uniref:Uncharacterized protein n=1 Tax=Penicillium thymicola TaxID=293382 RepID=A0AAI9XA92_PENTH|nr:hypothetical protein VN97_g4073 [Penicillium thymicola]